MLSGIKKRKNTLFYTLSIHVSMLFGFFVLHRRDNSSYPCYIYISILDSKSSWHWKGIKIFEVNTKIIISSVWFLKAFVHYLYTFTHNL